MPDIRDLLDVAKTQPVGIVGGGIAGLIVALECAKVGLPVTVWEAAEIGGALQSADVGGVRVDLGATAIEPSAAATSLLTELDVETQPALVQPRWLAQKHSVELPASAALGIPANPFLSQVVAVIGWRGSWRAYLDRLKPVLTIGREQRLGELVRTRMGSRVHDLLVAPVTRARFGLEPDDVLIDAALPTLNGALTRVGSLSGAVGVMDPPAAGVEPVAGMSALVEALRARIMLLGGVIVEHARVEAVHHDETGWHVAVRREDSETGEPEEVTCSHLMIATSGSAATNLLSDQVGGLTVEKPNEYLVVNVATRGARDVGGGFYSADPAGGWVSVDRQSARSDSPASPDVTVFRVRLTDTTQTDDEAHARAADIVSRLTGASPLAHRVDRFAKSSSSVAVSFDGRVQRIREAIATHPNLEVAGAWVVGSGVQRVIDDAVLAAERIRRAALFPEQEVDAGNGI